MDFGEKKKIRNKQKVGKNRGVKVCFFLIMGCTTAGLKSSGTAAVRREPFMIYRTVGRTAGGAGRGNDSRPHVNDLVYKESEVSFRG